MRTAGTGRAGWGRRQVRTGVVLAAALGLLAAPAASASAATSASYRRPLSGTFATTAGTFTLSGSVNIVVPGNPVLPPNPIVPGNPVKATLENTAATNGTLICRATGTASHQPAGGEGEISFTGTYRFTPGEPCDPLGDLGVRFSITYDEAGNPVGVTAQVGQIVT